MIFFDWQFFSPYILHKLLLKTLMQIMYSGPCCTSGMSYQSLFDRSSSYLK